MEEQNKPSTKRNLAGKTKEHDSYFWLIASRVRNMSSSRATPYAKTAILILVAYANLLGVNTRYIFVVIIPITVLVFIGALFIIMVSRPNNKSFKEANDVVHPSCEENRRLNQNDRKNSKTDTIDGSNKPDRNGGSDKDIKYRLHATAILPVCLLYFMGHFNVDNLVISPFFLFLTATLGELTLLMVRLPPEILPASGLIRRASLVVMLVAAHTMAAELLGDDVVLALTPELIAALILFSMHFARGSGHVFTVQKIRPAGPGIMVPSAVMAVLAYLAGRASTTGSEGLSILLSRYFISCLFSVILLRLGVFALREWAGQMTAKPHCEVADAIHLLRLCQDIMFRAAAIMFLEVTLLLGVAQKLRKCLDGRTMWISNEMDLDTILLVPNII